MEEGKKKSEADIIVSWHESNDGSLILLRRESTNFDGPRLHREGRKKKTGLTVGDDTVFANVAGAT